MSVAASRRTVVFLRGVNVGGHRIFRPAAFAKELSSLEVVNLGTAGTFVVRAAVTAAALRAELRRRLPVETEVMLCRGRELLDLVAADAFPAALLRGGVRPFVSILARRPGRRPALPLARPDGTWKVKVIALHGRFVLSLWRRGEKALVYPNEVVEKELAVPATTRGWDTVLRIHEALQAP